MSDASVVTMTRGSFITVFATLAMLNLALVVFVYFTLEQSANFRSDLIKRNFDFQHEISELLARCTLPPDYKPSEAR